MIKLLRVSSNVSYSNTKELNYITIVHIIVRLTTIGKWIIVGWKLTFSLSLVINSGYKANGSVGLSFWYNKNFNLFIRLSSKSIYGQNPSILIPYDKSQIVVDAMNCLFFWARHGVRPIEVALEVSPSTHESLPQLKVLGCLVHNRWHSISTTTAISHASLG